MKSSLHVLTGFSVETKDGIFGRVIDFLLGLEQWNIDFLKVEFGNIFKRKKLLIPPVLLGTPDWENHILPVDLREQDIARYSASKNQEIIMKEYIGEIKRYYGLDSIYSNEPSPAKRDLRSQPEIHSSGSSSLESGFPLELFSGLKGYRIRFEDQKTGNSGDLITALPNWKVGYLVVQMKDHNPGRRRVIIPIDIVSSVDPVLKQINILFFFRDLKESSSLPTQQGTGNNSLIPGMQQTV